MDYLMRGSRSGTARAAALYLSLCLGGAVALAGCSGESGVLVEITRNPETTPADIDRLQLVIGVSSVDHPDTFLVDSSSITEASVSGRDLVGDPFQLLVQRGARADAKLMVAVIAYKGTAAVGFAGFDAAQGFVDGQVLMHRLTLTKDLSASGELPGCVTWVDAAEQTHQIAATDDQDCDGEKVPDDCDDHNAGINHMATEICANGIDENCIKGPDDVTDDDLDGITNCAGDCNDKDATVHPGAVEICDGKDNDCNGVCDDGVLDQDHDRYNTCGEKIRMNGQCLDVGVPDCNDNDAAVHPDATEICDGKDNDCEGTCDVAPGEIDRDGDGVTACGTIPGTTPGAACVGPRPQLVDCHDDDSAVHPGAAEICDGKDDDCNGMREQHEPCYGLVANQCRVGVRSCDDDNSDQMFGLATLPGGAPDCQTADNGPTVSTGFCAAYDACSSSQPPSLTPFACANEMQATHNNKLDCVLFVKPDLSLCPEPRATLPIGAVAVNCHWQLIGGLQQAHYQVGLFDGGGGGGAQVSIDTCTGSFGVVDNLDFVPRNDQIYLAYRDDSVGPEAVRVSIAPMLTAQCPVGSGLQCTLVPPTMGP